VLDKNQLFFCGEYSSIDEVQLDQGVLRPGYANAMFGSMDYGFDLFDISLIEGTREEYFIRMAKNSMNHFLLIGSSSSAHINLCNDTLNNLAENNWGTSFLFSVLFDSSSNCINKKSVDFDYGGIISTSITELLDNSFLVSGIYNSTFIAIEGITLFNPNHEQRGFLYKFNSNGNLTDAFQLEGSKGTKRIESVVQDNEGNIWITGMNYSDTLRLGNYVLELNENDESVGYLAKLNIDLEPEFVLKLNGRGYKLIRGEDDFVYLFESLSESADDYRLFKINTLTNDGMLILQENSIDIVFYPNPARDYINIKVNEPLLSLEVCDLTGRLVYRLDQELRSPITIDIHSFNAGMYLISVMRKDGVKMTSKFFVAR
jgi:hypothetical protein